MNRVGARLSLRRAGAALAVWGALGCLSFGPTAARAAGQGEQYLADAKALYRQGQYFKAARYAFAAQEEDPALSAEAYSWVATGLIRAGLPNSASYFFIKTLQSGNTAAIRNVLLETEALMSRIGPDLLRQFLGRHTRAEDYDPRNRNAYRYALAKEALLTGDAAQAIGHLNAVDKASSLWPYALELRGTSHAITARNDAALKDFRQCAELAEERAASLREGEDLQARCQAGEARTLYQMGEFEAADSAYDQIAKTSLVWPDILFEQAWNSFGRREYNRTLGKLVSYKSPALSFVFNSEVDVLRAQSFLALCLYSDANAVINDFNARYASIGEQVKAFVEGTSSLDAFYERGKATLKASIYSKDPVHQLANRFVRTPYFQTLVKSEREVASELAAIRRFDTARPVPTERGANGGFPAFLTQVLAWRSKSIRSLGGAFVKNSLMDYHSELIADFEKMAFIKLEMLKRAKEKLLVSTKRIAASEAEGERSWGNVVPARRDDQYFWSFNGEFWNDELGDYVFGLESECNTHSSDGA